MKALTSDRAAKCRSRINQAVRDGCLEQYLSDFRAAVQRAQHTPFLCGEGDRAWRANFDWFIANHTNVYGVLEGKYNGCGSGSRHAGTPDLVGASDYQRDPEFEMDPEDKFKLEEMQRKWRNSS